jgi:Rod binding domain-containing protein
MREAGFKSDLLPESNSEKIFRSMLDEQHAQSMAQSEGSLAEALLRQLQPSPKKV